MSMTDSPVARPPGHLVVAGGVAVGVSAVLLALPGVAVNVVGYALATLVALTCVTAFRWLDNRRRQDVSYVPAPRLARVGTLTAVCALIVGSLHIWYLATELAS
jgi:membrane protein implicated in regulation of membrane protease activity